MYRVGGSTGVFRRLKDCTAWCLQHSALIFRLWKVRWMFYVEMYFRNCSDLVK